ncbi:hypothetical protein Tco_1049056 [Tanacetum coccineum]
MMANLSNDIEYAGSDTHPPMLERTNFESWQQCIRLYCLGKDNEVNILKSIDEGPFKMGKFKETLAEGVLHLGPEQDRVFVDLTPEEKERFKADIHAMNILLQGLPKDIYTLINHYIDAKDIWDNEKMLLEDLRQNEAHANENRMMLEGYNQHAIDPLAFVANVSPQQYPTQSAIPQSAHGRQNRGHGNYARGSVVAGNEGAKNRVGNTNPEYFKDKMLLMQAQENGVVLDEEQLLFIAGG